MPRNSTLPIVSGILDNISFSITYELLTTLASVTIMDGLAPIKNNMQV